MNCYFKMERDHTEFADHTAYAWYSARVRDGYASVGHHAGDDILWSYVRGCRLEMAFYLWLGGKESGAVWNHRTRQTSTREEAKRCDVEYKDLQIDVKGQPEGWDDCHIIRRDQVEPLHIYVLGSVHRYPLCVFAGWMIGANIMKCEIGGRPAVPGYIVAIDDPDLRDCMSLKDARYQI